MAGYMVGNCSHEKSVLDGKKSYCEIWERWTNCREVGYCMYRKYKGEDEPVQLTLFEMYEALDV